MQQLARAQQLRQELAPLQVAQGQGLALAQGRALAQALAQGQALGLVKGVILVELLPLQFRDLHDTPN